MQTYIYLSTPGNEWNLHLLYIPYTKTLIAALWQPPHMNLSMDVFVLLLKIKQEFQGTYQTLILTSTEAR